MPQYTLTFGCLGLKKLNISNIDSMNVVDSICLTNPINTIRIKERFFIQHPCAYDLLLAIRVDENTYDDKHIIFITDNLIKITRCLYHTLKCDVSKKIYTAILQSRKFFDAHAVIHIQLV